MQHKLGIDPQSARSFAEVAFDLPEATVVSITVEDSRKHVVEVLIQGLMPKGHHEVTWSSSLTGDDDFVVVLDTPTRHRVIHGKPAGKLSKTG